MQREYLGETSLGAGLCAEMEKGTEDLFLFGSLGNCA